MTDDLHVDDDGDLDDRLRGGLAALAATAPEPPPFPAEALADTPHPAHARSGRRSVLLTAAAVVVVAAIAGGAALVSSSDPSPSDHVRSTTPTSTATTETGTDRPDRPFYGTHWVMVSAIVDGEPERFTPGRRRPTVRYDADWQCPILPSGQRCAERPGPRFSYDDGCNVGGGSLAVEGTTIAPLGMGGTAMGCSGPGIVAPVFPAEREPESRGPVAFAPMTYRITGDRLVLTASPDQQLTYRATNDPFGPPDGAVVAQDLIATGEYRLVWEGPAGHTQLDFEGKVRRTPLARAKVAIDPLGATKVHAAVGSLGWQDVVFGLVPGETATATYRTPAGLAVPMTLTPLPDGTTAFQAVHAVVPAGAADWSVTASDADGGLIETYASASD